MLDTSKRKIFFTLTAAAVFLIMVKSNNILSAAVYSGTLFCVRSIIPSLFPFLIISKLISTYSLYPQKYPVLTAYVLGLLSGFPIGAKLALMFYESGVVSKKKAEYINAVSNNAGLSFVIGYASSVTSTRYILFVLLLISSALTALLLCPLYKSEKSGSTVALCSVNNQKSILECIKDSSETLMNICALIITFGCISSLISTLTGVSGATNAIISGVLEFSNGIKESAVLERNSTFLLTSVFLSWGGICVHCQVKAIIRARLSIKPYLLSHLLQAAIMCILSYLYLYIPAAERFI